VEPAKRLQEVIATRPTLDGVRVGPGAEFGPTGELMLAGLQPGLAAAAQKELNDAYQAVLKELIDKNDAASERYKRLATRGASAGRMKVVATPKLLDELRTWAADNLDDVRLPRLYFAADGGLTLPCQTVSKEDEKKAEAMFQALAKKYLPDAAPKIESSTFPASLTAHVRTLMTGDQKKWYGVLVERGYFDAGNHFAIRGVVDTPAQNEALVKLFDELKADARWAAYFTPAPAKPALDVIPIKELLDRVKRVTPAYAAFDGIRVESARYDASANLIFDAQTAGTPSPDAAPLLTKLLADSKYKRRVATGKKVMIVPKAGAGTKSDQLANLSLGFSAKALAAGETDKAKEWLDAGMLHYPNESAVWFLSAYSNHLSGDRELVRRDLFRVIELEGSLRFDGPAQRKRRYEAAKDLQGAKRTELEALWLECFKEAKDGAKPMTLDPPK
jgi:hypothetical protein